MGNIKLINNLITMGRITDLKVSKVKFFKDCQDLAFAFINREKIRLNAVNTKSFFESIEESANRIYKETEMFSNNMYLQFIGYFKESFKSSK